MHVFFLLLWLLLLYSSVRVGLTVMGHNMLCYRQFLVSEFLHWLEYDVHINSFFIVGRRSFLGSFWYVSTVMPFSFITHLQLTVTSKLITCGVFYVCFKILFFVSFVNPKTVLLGSRSAFL